MKFEEIRPRNVDEITSTTSLSFCLFSVLWQQLRSSLCVCCHALKKNKNSARVVEVIPCAFLSKISLIFMTLTACSSNGSGVSDMNCVISSNVTDCSAVPTLRNGVVSITSDRKFELQGQYSACYHEESVMIYGKYQNLDYGKGMSIELLATEIKGLKSSDFPSTIAVITLEKSSLKGVIQDVWATIRSPDKGNKSVVEVTCTPD